MNTTPTGPAQPDQPSWGTPSAPPAGAGSDSGTDSGTSFHQEPHHQHQHHQHYQHQQQYQQQAPRPPHPGQPGARFFDAVRALRVVRPDDGRMAAGVAAGLARRWNVDPLAVRILFVLLTLLGGFGITLYGLGWLLLPHPDGRIHAQQVLGGTVTAGFFGAVLTVLLSGPHPHGALIPLAIVAVIVWRVAGRRPHHPHQA